MVDLEDGGTVEVGVIGRDGFVGHSAILDTGCSPNRAFIQVAGSGFSVKAKILLDQSDKSRELRVLLNGAVQALIVQNAQTAACNRMHGLEERLARWILTCHDRIQSDRMPLTHEFLAMMLGTNRTTVTIAAGILQKAGLIEYSRGHITIRGHKGLTEAACECYRTIRDECVRLGLL